MNFEPLSLYIAARGPTRPYDETPGYRSSRQISTSGEALTAAPSW
ncbi:MAG TPA: hypothetical protein VIJ86_09205 [Acidimicrobiales bacterium]